MRRDSDMESDSQSDVESLPDEPNPLNSIVPAILSDLNHLDLTGRVVFKENKVVSGGAHGDIIKSHCRLAGRGKVKVAIKRLRFYLKEDVKSLFEREIYVWEKLRHPNVLPLLGYAFDSRTGFPLLVSEWMMNGSVWSFVRSHSECDLLRLVTGIARGLTYLHQNGVVHEDIKSDNILVTDSKDAVICDFGYSRIVAASRSLANLSTGVNGTPQYLAYELLAESNSKHSTKTDVWAFGMTLFELLTLQRPYADMSTIQVIAAILRGELPSLPPSLPNLVSPEVRKELWEICQLCWKYDPASRIDMDSILFRLERLNTTSRGHSFGDLDPQLIPKELKTEGIGWFAAFNPAGERVLEVNLLHATTYGSAVCCVRFSEDGKYLAVGSCGAAYIFETARGQSVHVLKETAAPPGCDFYIRSLCFSPDGKFLATAAEDGMVRIWDVAHERVERVLEGHDSKVYSVEFSKNGEFLVSGGGDGTLRIWDLESGLQLGLGIRFSDEPGVRCVTISPDGRFAAAGYVDAVVRLWNIKAGYLVETLRGHQDSVHSVAFTPDGCGIFSGSLDGTVKRWDISAVISRPTGTRRDFSSDNCSSNGNIISRSQMAGICGVVNITDFKGHKDHVNCLAVSRCGRWLLTGSKDATACIWDVQTSIPHLFVTSQDTIFSVDFSPAGGMFATVSGNKTVRMWSFAENLRFVTQKGLYE